MISKNVERKNNIWSISLASLLCIQLFFILYMNFFKNSYYLDCDMAKLFVHTIEMVKNKTIIIPNWKYVTTLELDCASIFAIPFFALTHNIFFSFALSITIFILLYIWTIYRLEEKNIEKTCIACILLFIPFGIDFLDYFNMMFFNGAQYVIKVLVPLMFISILCAHEEKEKSDIVYRIIFGFLTFITAFSSGIYVLICGFFPICLVWFGCIICQKKIINLRKIYFMLLSLVLYLVGLICHLKLQIDAKGNSMTLCSLNGIKENVQSVFWGIFELFKAVTYQENVRVLSYTGIGIIIRIVFTIALLIVAVCIFRDLKRHISLMRILCLSVFIWNLFILCICETRYGAIEGSEFRYHLIGVIPVFIIVASYIKKEILVNKYLKMVFYLFLLSINLITMKEDLDYEPYKVAGLQEICDYVESNESIHTVYFLNDTDNAEVCRLLNQGEHTYLTIKEDGEIKVNDYYQRFEQMPLEYPSSVLIINTEYHDVGENIDLWEHNYSLIQQVAEYNIYK